MTPEARQTLAETITPARDDTAHVERGSWEGLDATEGADWCIDTGSLAICGTRMREHSRDSEGVRWCFHCRKRHEFFRVVMVPDGMSYYGPTISIDGPTPDCTDLFPGWSRTWGED